MCVVLSCTQKLFPLDLLSVWSSGRGLICMAVAPAELKEFFPASWLSCLLPLPGPVSGLHTEEPLSYTLIAAIDRGHPLAGLAQWWEQQVCVLAPAGRKEQQAVSCNRGPEGCITIQEDGMSEAPECPQPAGLSMPG